jgi:hypothetical protein
LKVLFSIDDRSPSFTNKAHRRTLNSKQGKTVELCSQPPISPYLEC